MADRSEYFKQYREKNKEKIKEQKKVYMKLYYKGIRTPKPPPKPKPPKRIGLKCYVRGCKELAVSFIQKRSFCCSHYYELKNIEKKFGVNLSLRI